MPTIDLMELDAKTFSELWEEVEQFLVDSDDCDLEDIIFEDLD